MQGDRRFVLESKKIIYPRPNDERVPYCRRVRDFKSVKNNIKFPISNFIIVKIIKTSRRHKIKQIAR